MFFIDESGSAGTGGQFFVVGGLKTREPGHLLREIKAVRDKHSWFQEFKFSDITRRAIPVYTDLIQALASSDARLVAFVIDKRVRDPFAGVSDWHARAKVTSQLVIGNTNRSEVTTLLLDICSTPRGISIEEIVRRNVNEKFVATNLVSAVSFDSKASDGLQVADLIASAISYERRTAGTKSNPSAPKAIVAATLASQFGRTDFSDHRQGRVNILTSKPRRHRRSPVASATSADA